MIKKIDIWLQSAQSKLQSKISTSLQKIILVMLEVFRDCHRTDQRNLNLSLVPVPQRLARLPALD